MTSSIRAKAAAAIAAGQVRFVATCRKHGESEHYTATRRCCQCTAAAKSPAKQARYWAKNAETVNAARRAARKDLK